MSEETNDSDRMIRIEYKLDRLMGYVMPDKKDNSKFLQEIANLVVKGKPPRKQPKKKITRGGDYYNSPNTS